MATRERNCQFGVDEQMEPPCGECRRCCDVLKAELKLARGQRDYENTRKLDAVHAACEMRIELDGTKAKLATLEAAARAVRDDELIEWCVPDERVKELFELVPEVE